MIDLLVIISIIVILLVAYLKKQLTLTATIVAFLVGLSLYLNGGFMCLICLYVFFISASIASNINKEYKKKVSKIYQKSGKRDLYQVLANSFLAVMLASAYYNTNNKIFYIAVFIAFASYNADTWASEIGIMSKKDNYYLLGLKKVQKGISGAVTPLGLIASLFGSFLIASVYLFIDLDFKYFIIITILGFVSALIDSILGQLFQVLYYDNKTKKYTEKKTNKKIKGISFINNDVINFIAPLTTIIIYIIIRAFI